MKKYGGVYKSLCFILTLLIACGTFWLDTLPVSAQMGYAPDKTYTKDIKFAYKIVFEGKQKTPGLSGYGGACPGESIISIDGKNNNCEYGKSWYIDTEIPVNTKIKVPQIILDISWNNGGKQKLVVPNPELYPGNKYKQLKFQMGGLGYSYLPNFGPGNGSEFDMYASSFYYVAGGYGSSARQYKLQSSIPMKGNRWMNPRQEPDDGQAGYNMHRGVVYAKYYLNGGERKEINSPNLHITNIKATYTALKPQYYAPIVNGVKPNPAYTENENHHATVDLKGAADLSKNIGDAFDEFEGITAKAGLGQIPLVNNNGGGNGTPWGATFRTLSGNPIYSGNVYNRLGVFKVTQKILDFDGDSTTFTRKVTVKDGNNLHKPVLKLRKNGQPYDPGTDTNPNWTNETVYIESRTDAQGRYNHLIKMDDKVESKMGGPNAYLYWNKPSKNKQGTVIKSVLVNPDDDSDEITQPALSKAYIDKEAPVVTAVQNSDFSVTIKVEDDLSGEDTNGTKIGIAQYPSSGASTFTPGYSITLPADGKKYDVYVMAKDKAGNVWNNSQKVMSGVYNGYTLSYDTSTNGGSGTVTDSNIYNAGQEVNIKNGTGVIPPPGKLFDGWEYEGKSYNAGNTDTDKLTMPSKNITLKARYSDDKNNDGIPDKYQAKLTFKVGNPIAGSIKNMWQWQKEDIVRYVTLTKAGKWATAEEGGKYKIQASDIPEQDASAGFAVQTDPKDRWLPQADEAEINKDTEFTAQWKQLLFDLSFDTRGGEPEVIAPITGVRGVLDKIFDVLRDKGINNPTKEGYTFYAWYTQPVDAENTSGYNRIDFDTSMPLSNTTLYAGYKKGTGILSGETMIVASDARLSLEDANELKTKDKETQNVTFSAEAWNVKTHASIDVDNDIATVFNNLKAPSEKNVTFTSNNSDRASKTVKAKIYEKHGKSPKGDIYGNGFSHQLGKPLTEDLAKKLADVYAEDNDGKDVTNTVKADAQQLAAINAEKNYTKKFPLTFWHDENANGIMDADEARITVDVRLKKHKGNNDILSANDFTYGINEGAIDKETAKRLADVSVDGKHDISRVDADQNDLDKINRAISQGTVGKFHLKFKYDDGTDNDDVTVTVNLKNIVVREGNYIFSANNFSLRKEKVGALMKLSQNKRNEQIIEKANAVCENKDDGSKVSVKVYDTDLAAEKGEYFATFEVPNKPEIKAEKTKIKIKVTSQSLTVTAPNLKPGESGRLKAEDEKGNLETGGKWTVKSEVPVYNDAKKHDDGITIDAGTGEISIGENVKPGTIYEVEVSSPKGEGHATASVQDKGVKAINIVIDKALMPGETSKLKAFDESDPGKEVDSLWSIVEAKDMNGNPVKFKTKDYGIVDSDAICIDKDTGEIKAEKDVPIGTVVKIQAQPKDSSYKKGTITTEVQPDNAPSKFGLIVKKPDHKIEAGSEENQFRAYDEETGEEIADPLWSVYEREDNGLPGEWKPADPADLSISPSGKVKVGAGVKKGTHYKVVAIKGDKRGSETGEISKEKKAGETLTVRGPEQPLVAGGNGKFRAYDDDTGKEITDEALWFVECKKSSGSWGQDPNVTIEKGMVKVSSNIDERDLPLEIIVIAAKGAKKGSEEAVVQSVKGNIKIEITKASGKELNGIEKIDVIKGKWANDNKREYTVSLEINGKKATREQLSKIEIRPAVIGGFENISMDYKMFMKSDDNFKVKYVEDGIGTFSVDDVFKSGIVKFRAIYGGFGGDSIYDKNNIVAIVPGDVSRNGKIFAEDMVMLKKVVLGNDTSKFGVKYFKQLADMNGNDNLSTEDIVIINKILLGILNI